MLSKQSILTAILLLPVLGGLLILFIPAAQAKKSRFVALITCLVTFGLAVLAAVWFDRTTGAVQLTLRVDWIKAIGAQYFVGVDGLSLPLVLLTTTITLLACWASYGISVSVKAYYALLLFLLAGTIGVFVSLDLLLFYVFMEASLIPVYFLIGIWSGAKKEFAALKFFLCTLLGSIAILIVILGIYFHARTAEGHPVFDLIQLATDPAVKAIFAQGGAAAGFASAAFWLVLLGFAVKIPLVPLHTWLPEVVAEAPIPVSMMVMAVVLTVGGYGMVRVGYSVFPMQAAQHWFFVALIGVVSIIYGAVAALAQKDFKRMAAYASISQMGYVVLGIAVMTPMGTTGAIFQMLAHGISSAMMIFIAGVIFERAQHTEISRLGGIWMQMPSFTGWAIVGFFASMGVPGLCGFVGELLVLMGTFGAGNSGSYLMRHVGPWVYTQALWLGAAAAFAIILTTAYHLWTFQRMFMGEAKPEFHDFAGLTWTEKCILAVLGLVAIVLGVLPMVVLEPIRPTIEGLMRIIAG